jgi:cell division protein FtsB
VEPHVPDILRVIQLVVAPVFLLTAIGTLINALNARLGRAVDRRRVLEQLLRSLEDDPARTASEELARVGQRIRVTYLAIFAAVISALFVCLLIAVAFLGGFAATDPSRFIATLFVLAMVALIAALLLFLREIYLAVSTSRHV